MSTSFSKLTQSVAKSTKQPTQSRPTKPNASKPSTVFTPGVFLGYQQRWDDDQSQIKIAVKSRRIGLSWCDAADSTLEAAKSNGCNTFYLGYNKEMALEYIQACADWAEYYQIAIDQINISGEVFQEKVLESEKEVIAYRITFASGYQVQALSSTPRNIRSKGRPGDRLRIDEFAFHDNPEELLKAAIAFKMWGGKIAIWSTHNGKKSFFNQLIEEIKEGKRPFSMHEFTFNQAIQDGLHKRICLINGWQWTLEKEQEYIKNLRAEYGVAAAEELDCIPTDYNAAKFIDREWFKILEKYELPYCDRFLRFWDLAATEADLNKKKKPCNTAGVLLGYSTYSDCWVVLDCIAEAFNPSNTDALLQQTAVLDSDLIPIAHELEGGASGIRDAQHIKTLLQGYQVSGVRPQGDKLLRGRNFATAGKNGKVFILKGEWNEDFLDELDNVPNGLMDRYDAVVGAFNTLADDDVLSRYAAYFAD